MIRKYRESDCEKTAELFYHTVHTINKKDYTETQLNAWAPKKMDLARWNQSFQETYSLVAVRGGILVGFGNIDDTGYLDHLFVHKDYQRMGIATQLCDRLEQRVQGRIEVHASMTAKPFFEARGYQTVKKQQVECRGIVFLNYRMIQKNKKNERSRDHITR